MDRGYKILVVAPTPSLASTLVKWLGEARHELVLVTTFAAAKLHLKTLPDVLVTEVRLGEYNGLHVALRARAAGVPAIVLGPEDDICERETVSLGGAYLAASTLDFDEFLRLVGRMALLGRADRRSAGDVALPPSGAVAPDATAEYSDADLSSFEHVRSSTRPVVLH